MLVEKLQQRCAEFDLDEPAAPRDDPRTLLIRQLEARTRAQGLARTRLEQPAALVQDAFEQRLDLAPLALRANSLALITRVSLNTSRSPARKSRSKSRNTRSRSSPLAPSTARSRPALRSAAGAWAISSGGS